MEDNNNLERFFRNRIQNYKPDPNKWEADLGEVWEKTLPQISQPKKKRRIIWIWLLGFLLLSTAGYYFSKHHNRITQLEHQVLTTRDSLNQLKAQVEEIKFQTEKLTAPNQMSSESEIASLEYDQKKKTNKNINNSAFTIPQNPAPFKHLQKFQSTQQLNEIISNNKQVDLNIISNAKSNGLLFEKPSVRSNKGSTQLINLLPIKTLKVPQSDLELNQVNLSQQKVPKKYWLKLAASPIFFNKIIKDLKFPQFPLPEEQISGLQASLQFGRDMGKRWTFEVGLNYQRYILKGEFNIPFLYFSSNETLRVDGFYESSVPFNLNPGSSTAQSTLFFLRSPSEEIDEGTLIIANVSYQTTANYLQIPVLIHFKLTTGKCILYLRGGVSGNIALHNTFQFKAGLTNNPSLSFSHSSKGKATGLENYIFNYLVGMGLEYRINKNWSLNLEPTFSSGITPHSNVFGLAKIYLDMFSADLGIKHRF